VALLEELKTTAPTAEELERVRAQVAGLVYERDSITSQATAIGQLETVGLSWKLMDTELADLESVTPQDIQNAARCISPANVSASPMSCPRRPLMSERKAPA
jgi:zinc protease